MELLAPAGSYESLTAAIENGADAVYIGGRDFNARQGAQNFDLNEIKKALEYAHIKGRKIYVAVNTLIDNSEFSGVLDYIYELYQLAVDAIIVQDLGLVYAVSKLMPALPVHASTQMTIHNDTGVKYLKNLGIKRVVLARELSKEEIRKIKGAVPGVDLEIFIHGALCFSYSGQCLFSSMVGGRSGNRGRCAQACRLPYDLLAANALAPVVHGDRGRYILSPSDLCLIDYLADIKNIGVTSLKIEGRMKRFEYVAIVTRAYRKVLDSLEENEVIEDTAELKREMLQVFNRNFSSGYFQAERRGFLSSKRPNNRGVLTGRVVKQKHDGLTQIRLSANLNQGDGVEVWVARGKGPVIYVMDMRVAGHNVESAVRGEIVEFKIDEQVSPGDRVFKIHDAKLLSNAAQSARENSSGKIKVDVEVTISIGQPLIINFRDANGNQVEVMTESAAKPAEKHALDENILCDKLGRLGNTPFVLGDLTLMGQENIMIPISELNDARRRAVEQLISLNLKPYQLPVLDSSIIRSFCKDYTSFSNSKQKKKNKKPSTLLSIMVSGVKEARAAINAGADRVYLGLEGLGQARTISMKALNELMKEAKANSCELVPALPRIQKPGEEKEWEGLIRLPYDTIMIGNLGSLKWAKDNNFVIRADYSLNVFNNVSLNYLLDTGVEGVCLSPELNFKQLQEIKPLGKSEVVVHGEVMLMLSQFCVLRAMLGDEEGECPAFCRQADYRIKDDKGFEFPVTGDSKCRFYLFNSRTLCMLEDIDKLLRLGLGAIRIEARRQSAEDISQIVTIYRHTLAELRAGIKPDLNSLKNQLAALSASNFTKCHYYRGVL
ncbi:MAG: DUF3656 domain-containing U32 family peptidase [Syntrophomonadaceae bacterium]